MIKRELILKHVPNGNEICKIQLMNLIDKVIDTDINNQIEEYIPHIEKKLSHLDKNQLIKHFFTAEFNRFLSFYNNAPDLNTSENKFTKKEEKRKRNQKGIHAEKGYTRFFINIGKGKGLQAHNLIGLINEYTKKRNMPVGKIDIMRNFSFFEVPSDFESIIIKGFKKASWNDNSLTVEVSQDPKNNQKGKREDRRVKNKRRKKDSRTTKSKKRTGEDSKNSFRDRFRKRSKK